MEKLNENMIKKIQHKAETESENVAQAYHKKNSASLYYDEELTAKEQLQHKVIYSNEELDFVISNYQGEFGDNELLKNCLYLLEEFKQTKQTSKCNAVYNILNKYFTIVNTYDEPYSSYPEWDGFKIVSFIECPTALEEMIKEKVVKIKAEKQKQSRIDYKEKADKTDKEIIAELEL